MRRRVALSLLEPTLVVALGLAMGAALYWPLPRQLGAALPATLFTSGHLVATAVGADQLPHLLTTQRLGYPTEASFRPLLWPTILLARVKGPVTALGFTFLATPAVNALSGWLAGRLLSLPAPGRWTLAALCAVNLWSYTTLANGQVEQAFVGGVALIWAAVIAAARHDGAIPIAGIVLLAFGLAAPHVALVALVGLTVLGPLLLLSEPGWIRTALRLGGSALALGAGGWLVRAYHAGTVGNRESVFFPKGIAVSPPRWQFETATWTDLLDKQVLPPSLDNAVAHTAYLGWAAMAAALFGLRRRTGWPLLTMAVALLFSAMGPTFPGTTLATPMQALIQLAPNLQASLNPYRAAMGVVAALTLLAGIGTQLRYGWALALLTIAANLAEWDHQRARGLPLPLRGVGFEAYAGVLKQGEGPVLELPIFDRTCAWDTYAAAVQAVAHHRPIYSLLRPSPDLNAYGRSTPTFRALRAEFADTGTCAQTVKARIEAMGARTVVLHDHVQCSGGIDYDGCLTSAFGVGQSDGQHQWWELP